MSLKQSIINCIPDAYYSNGTKATCMTFKIFNMFDIDSHSFKAVKEIPLMEKEKREETIAKPGNLNQDFHKVSDKED